MRLLFILVILTLINTVNVYPNLIISEIMYDPDDITQCPDANCEYIEIYNPTNISINLNNWKLCNDLLFPGYINNTGQNNPPIIKNDTTTIQPNSYAIITDGYNSGKTQTSGTKIYQVFNVSGHSVAFHVERSDLCNSGLSNSGELISLSNNEGNITDYVDYSNLLGQEKGKSLQKINTNWCYANPTPGKNNSCNQDNSTQFNKLILINNLPQNIYGNGTPVNLFLRFIGFENGLYDLKLDIKNKSNETIGRVYDNIEEEWQSSNNYINDAFFIDNNSLDYNILIKIDETKGYDENALFQVKVRRSGSTTIISRSETYYVKINNHSDLSINKIDQPYIKITNLPEEIKFGDYIDIDVEVYRGNSSRQVAYFYFQDEEKRKISDISKVYVRSKFLLNESTITLKLKCKNEEGNYKLVGDGLNVEIKKDVKLYKCDTNSSNLNEDEEQLYQIEFQDRIRIGEEFKTKIRIENREDIPKVFTAWSYIYKSSKCYSCFNSREENAEQKEINPNSIESLELNNIIESAPEGDYKLKVKILKEGLKMPKEFTYDIILEKTNIHSQDIMIDSYSPKDQSYDKDKYQDNKISGEAIYSSSDIKTKNISWYILIITLILIIIIILFRKGL